ncbi:serine/threonine-protein kinase ULK3 isoform X2 [Rissa tridactyla]|uniref:serine/threonine-protein kinase ULK3 isoform X2 n=1 Tax=Rissa tridactyla TaxID=75485 RepID=UPI0023BAE69C|nr:serine/threonine-protein kinase ULK3 isoform X2 [Rissa tridactyla]
MAGAGWAPPRLDGFILTERLGAGTYATVYKAYRKRDTREVVAIKCVSKRSLNRASVENLLTEIEILKTIRHPHIVELKDFQWDSDHIYLIMEFCAGGDLSRFIRMRRILPEKVARIFLQQLGKGTLPSSVGHPPWGFLGARTLGTQVATCSACALKFLHDHNISHLDLKPQNILLSAPENPQLKLADFGFAQHMSPWDEKHVLRGSPLYMAPEMVCRQQYDARVDLWSVGVILYEALFGRPPFASRSFAELEEKIRSDRAVELPSRPPLSPECRDLLGQLLERDPLKRISFEHFFAHPFVDMEHVPGPESLCKATDLVVEAVKKDQEGDAPAALSLYCKALEYFVPALHYESDARRKEAIRVKVRQYISRAEELKAVVTSSSKNFLQQGNSAREILKEMAKDKPRLIAALEMASAAMAKEEEGKDDGDTLELYQQSLGELLLLLAAEPAGRRRELLHTEIQTLMARAEYLKDQMKCVHVKHRAEQQQSDLKAKPVLEGLAWSVPALCYPFPGGGLDELGLILISFPTPSPAFSWRTQRPCKSQWQLIRSVGIWGSKHPACASSFQEARRQEPTTCQDAGKPPELLRFGVIHLDLSRFYSPQRRVLAGSSPADIPTEPVRPWRGAGKGLEGFLLK